MVYGVVHRPPKAGRFAGKACFSIQDQISIKAVDLSKSITTYGHVKGLSGQVGWVRGEGTLWPAEICRVGACREGRGGDGCRGCLLR